MLIIGGVLVMSDSKQELLFVRTLLVYGGDPEPDIRQGSREYLVWRAEIRKAIHDDILETDFVRWLVEKKLHYDANS